MPTPGFSAGDAKQENDPVARMGGLAQWTLFPIWSLGGSRPNGRAGLYKNLFGWGEAISYAAIIYSSLGREEKAFTGVINIFGSPLCSGLLGGCHPTLRTIWDGLFKKAHRLIGDISQSAIYSPIYFHTPFKANFK